MPKAARHPASIAQPSSARAQPSPNRVSVAQRLNQLPGAGRLPLSRIGSDAAPAWQAYIAPIWAGIWAALAAFALSFMMIALVVLVALMSDGPGTSWAEVLTATGRFWLLSHGSTAMFDSVLIGLAPLGLTLLAFWVVWLAAGRLAAKFGQSAWVGALSGTVAYAFATVGVAQVLGSTGAAINRAAVGAAALALAAFGARTIPTLQWARRLARVGGWPAAVGVRAGAIALAATTGLAASLTAVWATLGHSQATAATEVLGANVAGAAVLGAAELALLPNWLAWAAAWLVGPGFELGVGTAFAPGNWHPGPLPALPLVAALPPASWVGLPVQWVPALVMFAGALAAGFIWHRLPGANGGEAGPRSWWALLLSGALTLVLAGAAMLGAQWLARGAVGVGRLAQLGADPLLVAALFAGELALGLAMVFIGKQVGNRPVKGMDRIFE